MEVELEVVTDVLYSLIYIYLAYSEDSPKEPQGTIVIYEVDKNKKPQETLKVGLPLSMEKFFDIFFSDEAVFSYAQSMELNGLGNI